MEVHFIYVCKLKSYGSDLKFTFYYLFQIPGFHSRVCFTLTVADPLQVVSSVYSYKKTCLSLGGEKGDRHRSTIGSLNCSQKIPSLTTKSATQLYSFFLLCVWERGSLSLCMYWHYKLCEYNLTSLCRKNIGIFCHPETGFLYFVLPSKIPQPAKVLKTVALAISVQGFDWGQPDCALALEPRGWYGTD